MHVKRIYMVPDGSDINEKAVWMWFEERECYRARTTSSGPTRMSSLGTHPVK